MLLIYVIILKFQGIIFIMSQKRKLSVYYTKIERNLSTFVEDNFVLIKYLKAYETEIIKIAAKI